jgi:hypothetical protein
MFEPSLPTNLSGRVYVEVPRGGELDIDEDTPVNIIVEYTK